MPPWMDDARVAIAVLTGSAGILGYVGTKGYRGCRALRAIAHRANIGLASIERIVSEIGTNGGRSLKDQVTRIDDRTRLLAARQRAMAISWATPAFECDELGLNVMANAALEKLTGYSEHLIAGAGWVNLYHSDDRHRMSKAWKAAVDDGRQFQERARMVRANTGEVITVDVDARPMPCTEGEIVGWFGTVTPVAANVFGRHAPPASPIERMPARGGGAEL